MNNTKHIPWEMNYPKKRENVIVVDDTPEKPKVMLRTLQKKELVKEKLLLEEHRKWARDFGIALLYYLQGEHSAIDLLAHDMKIVFDRKGEPILESKFLED